ncbi:hypothetical protein HWV62_45525 [Athelia sp. TMB]|nr:hypothetical protein HWV62_45525 [Athelia sp. TMB]
MDSSLPLLLPARASVASTQALHEWTPKQYLNGPQPPPMDDLKQQELEMAAARQMADGKVVKKTRPRRTVDYTSDLGRWANWTPEGRRVLTGSTSGEFTLWNGLTFNFETILQAHDTAIRAISFTHSGAYLASADQSGIIKYFQPNMNNLTAWNGHREAIRGLSFSPDDGRFATASDDSTIRIWAFEESRMESSLTGHGWDVKCVEWHPTKGLLVSGSKDNLIKFWDPRTGTVLSTLHQHKNTVQALAWSPNGHMVASASRDQTVRVFDIRAMKEFRVLKGHKKEVCSVTWHPFHSLLVSGGSEGALLHWDLAAPEPELAQTTSSPRATLSQAHDSNVWSMAFHPLGHLLVTASNDHTTRFWSRERPGDAGSVFSGGGEKPPDVVDMSGQDDEDDQFVPGFAPGGWYGKEEDGAGMGGSELGPGNRSRAGYGESTFPGMSDDFIPGFGGGGAAGEEAAEGQAVAAAAAEEEEEEEEEAEAVAKADGDRGEGVEDIDQPYCGSASSQASSTLFQFLRGAILTRVMVLGL